MTGLDVILAEVIRARVQAEAAERSARVARKGLESLQAQIEAVVFRDTETALQRISARLADSDEALSPAYLRSIIAGRES